MSFKIEMSLTPLVGVIFQVRIFLNGQGLALQFDRKVWQREFETLGLRGPLDLWLHVSGEDRARCVIEMWIDGECALRKELEVKGTCVVYHLDAIPLLK